MTIRAAFVECTGDLWVDLADRLVAQRGWLPVYWSGGRRMQNRVQQRYPAAAFHENTNATTGILPLKLRHKTLPTLDESLLQELGHAESVTLHMMDRMDPDGCFGFHQREAHYHQLLRNGLAILDHCRPDVVVFSTSPHLIYDFVLYQLCRLRDIETRLFHETAVDGLILATDDYERPASDVSIAYTDLCRRRSSAQLSRSAQQYFDRVCDDYALAIPGYLKDLHDDQLTGRPSVHIERHVEAQLNDLARRRWKWKAGPPLTKVGLDRGSSSHRSNSRWGNRVRQAVRRLANKLLELPLVGDYLATIQVARRLRLSLHQTGRVSSRSLRDAMICTMHLYHAIETQFPVQFRPSDPDPDSFLKQFAVPPQDSRISYLEYWLFRLIGLRKKQHLLSEYCRVSQRVDLDQPYVYLALHYQPEKSTSPEGGVFANQFLIADMLSKTVPNGWKVYIKEHAFQFDSKGSGELSRSLDFYRSLAALPNVEIVTLDTNPFELIDNAKAVATVTGTSGWESVLRGTPALVFGRSWYNDCEGVFCATSQADCRHALHKIQAGYRPDREKVKLFLQALESVGFRGFTIPELSAAAQVTDEDNVSAFFEALADIEVRRQAA